MTTATATETKTFIVRYLVTTIHSVAVERPADITEEDLRDSITGEEVSEGDCEVGWDDVKEAWRQDNVDAIYDKDYNKAF